MSLLLAPAVCVHQSQDYCLWDFIIKQKLLFTVWVFVLWLKLFLLWGWWQLLKYRFYSGWIFLCIKCNQPGNLLDSWVFIQSCVGIWTWHFLGSNELLSLPPPFMVCFAICLILEDCGLHWDHWPPVSLPSLPSALRLGPSTQGPNSSWLHTCQCTLSWQSFISTWHCADKCCV